MLTLEFNEKDQRLIAAFNKLERKLQDNTETWTTENERAHQILMNAIAYKIYHKTKDLPWN